MSKCRSANVGIHVDFVLERIFLVSNCQQMSADFFFVSKCQQNDDDAGIIQFRTSQALNGHGFRLRPARICPSVTTKRVLGKVPDLPAQTMLVLE
jgi:hypothetical protein